MTITRDFSALPLLKRIFRLKPITLPNDISPPPTSNPIPIPFTDPEFSEFSVDADGLAENVDDPKIMTAVLVLSVLELKPDLQLDEEKLTASLAHVFELPTEVAEELVNLGRWYMRHAGGPVRSVQKFSQRLLQINEPRYIGLVCDLSVQVTHRASEETMTAQQKWALAEICAQDQIIAPAT